MEPPAILVVPGEGEGGGGEERTTYVLLFCNRAMRLTASKGGWEIVLLLYII